jgi:hypothetical protein
VPKQAVGANLVYFDLFNATGSGVTLYVRSVLPIISGAVAVTGTLGVDLFLTYTTAVGTGGTAATMGGTSLTAATITCTNPKAGAPSALVTARLTPSGGATAGAVITQASVFTEETNSAAYAGTINEMVDRYWQADPIRIPEGAGIRIVQGSVASVGNIGFDVSFDCVPSRT